jgi:uncharacterized membrane protein YhhN
VAFETRLGTLRCISDCGPAQDLLVLTPLLVSLIAMLVYGLALAGRSPSAFRTVIKMLAVGGLVALCVIERSPPLLIAGLAACVIGDAFLACDPKRWLAPGLVAFLVGHACYIFLFAAYRPQGLEPDAMQVAGLAGVAIAALAVLAFLWNHLGPLRPAVVLYVVAIGVMTGSSLLLPMPFWPAMAGSVAFMASDAVLAIGLFRGEALFGSTRLSGWAVWFLYYAAQFLIVQAFIWA